MESWISRHKELADFEQYGQLPTDIWNFYYDSLELLKDLSNFIHPTAKISVHAEITGNVIIEEGAQILPYSIIQGPTYIGKNAIVGNYCFIRPKSLLAQDSLLGNHSYCNEGFIGPKSRVSHFCGFSRSIICRNSTLSAFVLTSTLRADYKPITHNKKINIPKRGCVIGNNTFIAPHTTISPNVSIGNNCFIGSFLFLSKNLPDNKSVKMPIEPVISENSLIVGERIVSGKHLFEENEK